jgi:hypothetical protein
VLSARLGERAQLARHRRRCCGATDEPRAAPRFPGWRAALRHRQLTSTRGCSTGG